MKKIIATLAAVTLGVSATLTTTSAWKFNNTFDSSTNPYFENLAKKANNIQDEKMYSHLAQRNPYHQYKTDDPQTIVNDITTDHFFVPENTNPDLTNAQTLATIKKYLQKNNPKLSTSDLSYINLSATKDPETLSPSVYSPVLCAVIEGSAYALKTIYVKLSSTPATKDAVNLYNPLTPNVDGYTVEKSYFDDVFLKSLVYDPTKKSVISSQSKLSNTQDIKDYQSMIKTGNIDQGLSLVNRYLQSGLIKYNQGGYIPTRTDLIAGKKQKLITLNQQVGKENSASLSDYLTMDLHWWGYNLTLKPELISAVIEHFLAKAVDSVWGETYEGQTLKNGSIMTEVLGAFIAGAAGAIVTIFGNLIITLLDTVVALLGEAIGAAIDAILDPTMRLVLIAVASLIAGAVLIIMQRNTQKKDGSTFSNGGYLKNGNYFSAIDNKRQGVFNVPTVEKPKNDDALIFSLQIEYHFFDFWNDKLGINLGDSQSVLAYSNNPSNFSSSLHKSSTITGNANDFTISTGYDDLDRFADDLTTGDTQTLPKLFSSMHWKNVDNFKGLTVQDLENLQKNYPQTWQLPSDKYMALIHVIKTNGVYHIAWSNLDSDQDKESLAEQNGSLNASFLNEVNNDSNYLNTFTSEKVYDNISTRYRWIESNWKDIKKGKQVTEKTPEQYFKDTVLDANHLDLYNVNLPDVINSMQVMTSIFKDEVATSHLLKSQTKGESIDSTIMNIYWSNQNPLKPSVQID